MNPEEDYYTTDDARALTTEVLITNGILLATFAGGIVGLIPWWIGALIINVALVRWMLGVHELFHIQDYKAANPLARLFLLPFTPVNIGYLEYRQAHLGHHRDTANADDPDAFHIRGGHLRSFIGALLFPEGSVLNYLQNEENVINWWEVALRLSLFIGLATWGGGSFWLYWALLRINYAISVWVFFHHLHYRNGEYGSFALPLAKPLKAYFGLVYGKAALYATMHHDTHHLYPKVMAVRLPALAERIRAKETEAEELRKAG